MIKIGIDARFYGKAGPGRYTKNIIQHLELIDNEHMYYIFLGSEAYEVYKPNNPKFVKILANYSWYSFDEQIRYLFLIMKYRLNLYYVPHFNIPVLYPWKIITAIPDMTMHTYSTEKGTTLPLWYFHVKKMIYKLVFWWSVHRSYKVIVPSKTVLDEFNKNIKFIKPEKYILAYEGVDPDFMLISKHPEDVLRKYRIDEPFLLSVGSMYEHKNVRGLIEMYKILKDKYNYGGKLVLVSKKDKFSKRIYEEIKRQKLDESILILAYRIPNHGSDVIVTDEEIVELRQKAQIYVMAAFKEGFSLTALEGMAVGLPAVISDIDCHREVYGDSVWYFDPFSPEDMAQKVHQLLNNKKLYVEYKAKGLSQVKKYDWKETARITKEVFESALE